AAVEGLRFEIEELLSSRVCFDFVKFSVARQIQGGRKERLVKFGYANSFLENLRTQEQPVDQDYGLFLGSQIFKERVGIAEFYQPFFAPALNLACNGKFNEIKADPATQEFLDFKSKTLDSC